MKWNSRAALYVSIFLLAGYTLLAAPSATAQTVYGSMAGTVTDTTGAVIAGAKVQARTTRRVRPRRRCRPPQAAIGFRSCRSGPTT
jgi:hypothetical protein